ncbi:MAG: alpha-ketoacid dehydrogenase subunit beta [Oscillospiraceae bacterium]|nr:alpha-ketoacid dehydrogenase subunit beta [Oscillospiraceae bacterium]
MKKLSYNLAIADGMREEMKRDETVIQIGLDLASYGDSQGQTIGLGDEFGPKRVMDFPISETSYTGIGIAAAAAGLRPLVCIQFCDWMTLASDQLVNQGAVMRYMYGGQYKFPVVIRGNCGGYISAAAQHSKMLEAWFAHIPGLKVVLPSTPWDAKGLIKAAIRDDNPVLFFEHKALMPDRGEVSEDPDYVIPLGKADIKRKGSDVTIVCYSYVVKLALEAAEILAKEGIDVEVVDLRTVKPLDTECILESVKKTGRALCLQETWLTCSIMSEVSALISEQAFEYLNTPVVRMGQLDVPYPFSPPLEKHVLPSTEKIVDAVRKMMSE